MTGKLKEIYNTKLIIIDQLYKSMEEDKNISESEEKNKHIIKNKDFLLKEFEGLFNMENFNDGFENFVSDIYKNFKKDLVNDPFHKRDDRKKIFNLINLLNRDFKNIVKKNTNIIIRSDFIYLLCFLIVFKSAFFLKNDNSMIDLTSKESNMFKEDYELLSCNDRHKLIEKIENELEMNFMIISNAFKIDLNLENLNEWIVVFIMFLEDNDILITNDKDIRKIKAQKSSFVFTTKYSFKYETDIKEEKDLKFFYNYFCDLNINSVGIIIFENKFYCSTKIKLKKNFQISEDLFKMQELIKENPNYKKIKNKSDNTSYVFDNEDRNSVFWENMNLFKKFVFKTKNTKRYINWDLFEYVIDNFHIKKIKKYKLNLKSEYRDFHKILLNYSYIDSTDNKNDFKAVLELLYLKIFFENFKENDFFYSLFFFDFRGRLYFRSLIYITNFKLSRFYSFYGNYSIDKIKNIVEESKKCESYKLLKKYTEYVKNIQSLEKIFNPCYFVNDEIDLEFKINILISELISLGVIFKSELLKDGIYEIDIKQFLDLGIKKLKTFKEKGLIYFINNDQEDFLKIKTYCERIVEERQWLKMEKSSFDSSCSGHQIRNYLNSYSKLEDYSLINLAGQDKFVDYYSFIINKFLNYIKNNKNLNEKYNLCQKKDIIDSLFTRSILKKSLMTVEYNCTFITFLEYIKINLKEKNYNLYKEIFENKKNKDTELISLLSEFYNYCRNGTLDNEYLNLKIITEGLINNNFQISYIDDFKSSFAFFSKLKGDKRITYYSKNKKNKNDTNFKRFTKPIEIYNSIYNKKLSTDKLMPHLIHGCDGVIVRRVGLLNNFSYVYETIHDEYWIPALEQFLFKDLMNYIFKLKLFKEKKKTNHKSYTEKTSLLGDIYCFFIIL